MSSAVMDKLVPLLFIFVPLIFFLSLFFILEKRRNPKGKVKLRDRE